MIENKRIPILGRKNVDAITIQGKEISNKNEFIVSKKGKEKSER